MGDGFDQEIIDRNLRRRVAPRIDLRAQGEQRVEVAIGLKIEMWHGGFRLDQTPRDGAPHRAVRDRLILTEACQIRRGIRFRRNHGSCGRCGGALGRALHIHTHDPPAGARARKPFQIHVCLGREPACKRRGHGFVAAQHRRADWGLLLRNGGCLRHGVQACGGRIFGGSNIRRLFALAQQHDDHIIHIGPRALGYEDLTHPPRNCGLQLHRRLIGLDLRQRLAHRDQIALSLKPARDHRIFHPRRERGQRDFHRHVVLLIPPPEAGPDRP